MGCATPNQAALRGEAGAASRAAAIIDGLGFTVFS
jgi:hypothetical protein